VSYLADYFVMVTGYSRVQVRAISEAIKNKGRTGVATSLRTEGQAEGTWVLQQDYGDVMVHIAQRAGVL